jgi:iron complex transport system substrate-binding protein
VLDCIGQVAAAANVPDRGIRVVGELRARVDAVITRAARLLHRPRVALLEWLDPPFSAGHWNPELVRLAGGVDGLGVEGAKSRTLSWAEVVGWQPEVVLISCCGFTAERAMQDVPVLERVRGWDDVPAVRDGRVFVTDGASYFSRPGPRLVDSLELVAHVIDADVHPLPPWVQQPIRASRTAAATRS